MTSVSDGDVVARRRSTLCLAYVRQDDADRFLDRETLVSELGTRFITIDDAVNERNGLKMKKLLSRLSNG